MCQEKRHAYIAQLPQPAKLDLLYSTSTSKIPCINRRWHAYISGATTAACKAGIAGSASKILCIKRRGMHIISLAQLPKMNCSIVCCHVIVIATTTTLDPTPKVTFLRACSVPPARETDNSRKQSAIECKGVSRHFSIKQTVSHCSF